MTFAHRVLSATSQLTLSNGVVRLLAIVTMPILTALVSPEAYGVATLAATIISLASVLALAGIDTSYLRAYPSAEAAGGAAAEHYCWRFATSSALVIGLFGSLAWYFFSGHSIDPDHRFTILIAIGVVFSVLSTMSQVRAILRGSHAALAKTIVITGLIGSAASIVIAFWRRDALALLIPLLLGYLIPILLLGTPSISGLMKASPLSRNEGAALIKIGLAGVVTAPMYWLLSSSDRWFLQHYYGADAVGIYAIGYSVAVVGMMVNTAVMTVWQPEAAREYDENRARAETTLGRLMSRLIVAMAIIWLMAAAAGGDIVRWLANERFHAAAEYVPYIAGGVFFYGVLRLGTTGLLVEKQLQWSAWWWFAGGVLCTLLNLVLVPRYGGLGAAVTQSLSFAFIATGILATAQAKFRAHLDWNRLATTLLVVVVAGIFLAPSWHRIAGFSLLMKLPVGCAVALAAAWLIAPDWCLKGIDYMRRKAFL